MEMAARRMMEAVPEADVVITNPIHLAVALQFDAAKMVAPVVVAKGAGHLAERIKEIARNHQVPIIEDKPLAQALHKMVEIGEYIPVELYRTVAEVLAYVYPTALPQASSSPSSKCWRTTPIFNPFTGFVRPAT